MGDDKKPNQSPGTPSRGAEVTCIGRYARPAGWGAFKSAAGDAKEIALAKAKKWSPTTDYFRLVANTPNGKRTLTELFEIGTVGEFLGAMTFDLKNKQRKPKSVGRVNLITHGNPGLIGIGGSVDDDGETRLLLANRGDPLAGGGFDGSTVDFLNGSGQSARDDIREILTDDAEIHLILCHGGLGKGLALIQDMALCFERTIRGFSEAVFFHLLFDSRIVERNLTSIGETGTRGKGYKCFVTVPTELAGDHLAPNRSASPPKKKP